MCEPRHSVDALVRLHQMLRTCSGNDAINRTNVPLSSFAWYTVDLAGTRHGRLAGPPPSNIPRHSPDLFDTVNITFLSHQDARCKKLVYSTLQRLLERRRKTASMRYRGREERRLPRLSGSFCAAYRLETRSADPTSSTVREASKLRREDARTRAHTPRARPGWPSSALSGVNGAVHSRRDHPTR
ncbi:hypothetical protein VTO73DRAFT_13400 [Trametes versicolor]